MKKFLKMFGLVWVAFVMGGSIGIVVGEGMWNIFAGIPMVLGWMFYLWYIMLGLFFGYTIFSFLVLLGVEKFSMRKAVLGEGYKVIYYILNVGVPFMFGIISFVDFSPYM